MMEAWTDPWKQEGVCVADAPQRADRWDRMQGWKASPSTVGRQMENALQGWCNGAVRTNDRNRSEREVLVEWGNRLGKDAMSLDRGDALRYNPKRCDGSNACASTAPRRGC